MATITANTGTGAWGTGGTWVGGVAPTSADDAVIPSGATVTIAGVTVAGRSLTVQSGGAFSMTSSSGILNLGDAGGGGLSVSSGATITAVGSSTITFLSSASCTIDTGGKMFARFTFNNSGTHTLLGDVTLGNNWQQPGGTVNTGGYDCQASTFSVSPGATLNAAGSTFTTTLGTSGTIWSCSVNATLTGAPSITVGGTAGSTTRTFVGGNKTYGTFTCTATGSAANNVDITGNNTFDTFEVAPDATYERNLRFGVNSCQIVRNFNVTGVSGRVVNLVCATSGGAADLHLVGSNPTALTDWLAVQDIYVSIPYTGWLGANTTIGSNCRNVYAAVRPTGTPLPVNASAFTATTTSLNVPFDTPTTGNILLAAVLNRSTMTSLADPSGWTPAFNNAGRIAFFYKVSDGTETSVTFSHSGTSQAMCGYVIEIDSAGGYTPSTGSVNDTASTAGATSLQIGSGNSITPLAFVMAGWSAISSMSASQQPDQDFEQCTPNRVIGTGERLALRKVETSATVNPTLTWSTSRATVAGYQEIVFTPPSSTSSGDPMLIFI